MFTSLWHNPLAADENQSVSYVSSTNNNNKKRIIIRDALKPIALYPNIQNKPTPNCDKDEEEEEDHNHKKARTR
jgi:hypothetical protein